jgi:hypothetical protein
MLSAEDVASRVKPDGVAGDRGDRPGEGDRHITGEKPGISPQHPPPPPRRQPAIREQQDDQREQRSRRCPQRHQQHRDRCQRPAVAKAVAQHRVVTGVDAKHHQQGEENQQPAQRVAWLMPRDNDAYRRADQHRDNRGCLYRDRQLMDKASQRDGRGHQPEHHRAEDGRGPR